MKSFAICVSNEMLEEVRKIDTHITWIEQSELLNYCNKGYNILQIDKLLFDSVKSVNDSVIESDFLYTCISFYKNSKIERSISTPNKLELDNTSDIKHLLSPIIQSSEEAISVVDMKGKGILVNKAYTRLTGVQERDVIGKYATADISEGESVHLQVLKTRKPVRGVRLKVGPHRKDVIVNVAPIIVDGVLKGSVGVLHDVTEIKLLTKELDRAREIIRNLEARYTFNDIIGDSKGIQEAIESANLAATTPVTVLLRGESGTGKELFAHAIHNASHLRYNKFIRVNCAALSESLLESELFGYVEGAFTGAKKGGKRGLFEEANNGSIFLDEIGELSPSMQAKILRVLQENEIRRVGGTSNIPIKVRVIAATNANLEKAVSVGKFREDLYYRLNRLPIFIPPLRDRLEDIEKLGNKIVEKISHDYGKRPALFTNDAIALLKKYHWPGNVRELENIIGRALIYLPFSEEYIKSEHIPSLKFREKLVPDTNTKGLLSLENISFEDKMCLFEGNLLEEELARFSGNKTKAAKSLGISLRSLYYKLEKYDHAKNVIQNNNDLQ